MIPQDIIELECVEHATLYSNVKGIMNWGICPRAKGRATAMASTIPLDYHRGGHTRAGAKNPSEVDCVLCLDQTMLPVAQLLDSSNLHEEWSLGDRAQGPLAILHVHPLHEDGGNPVHATIQC